MLETPVIYKSFDTSEFLFEVIWKKFPSILSNKSSGISVLNELLISSKQFCTFQNNNMFSLKTLSEGGFGLVSKIGMDNKVFKAAVYNFNTKRSKLFYANVIAKIAKQEIENIIYRISLNTISITDPLSDMVFGSALSHLYDLGICPFVTKYFGTYLCDNNKTTMIIESADIELYKLLSRHYKKQISPLELKNIICQYYYCLMVIKHYYGAVHFDSHLRNLMVTDINISENYSYRGIKLKNVKYMVLETGVKNDNLPVYVVLKMRNYLLKLIDYGCMVTYFDRSKVNRFKQDLRIETNYKDISMIGAAKALENSRENHSYANTVDVMFTLINMYYFFDLELDNYNGNKRTDMIDIVNECTLGLIGVTMTEFLKFNQQFQVPKIDGKYIWFMNNHDTGIKSGFADHKCFGQAMLNLCDKTINISANTTEITNKQVCLAWFDDINIKDVNENNGMFLSYNAQSYAKMFNRLYKVMNYESDCNLKNSIYCKVFKLYDNQKSLETYKDDLIYETGDNFIVRLKTYSTESTPYYKPYNRWLNTQQVPRDKIGYHIEESRVFLITLNNIGLSIITENTPMIDSIGLSFPVGNDIVVNNKVVSLGYFARNGIVTQYLYPPVYESYLAILYCDKDDNIKLSKYSDFVKMHKNVSVNVPVNPSLEVKTNAIQEPPELIEGEKYKWAVTVGPILLWDRKIVFDKNILTHAQSPYDIFDQSRYMFNGIGPGKYSMTDSNEIQTQLLYAESRSHKGFILVEGGGFLTPGLDRDSCAKLARNLGCVNAVCVYSGYSCNVLIKNKYLSKSPIRNTHGAVLNIQAK